MGKTMKELILRLKAETPLFFKRMQWFGASLVGIEISLKGYQSLLGVLPDNFMTIGGHLATVGVTIVIVSQFAVKNMDILKGLDDDKNVKVPHVDDDHSDDNSVPNQ